MFTASYPANFLPEDIWRRSWRYTLPCGNGACRTPGCPSDWARERNGIQAALVALGKRRVVTFEDAA